MSHSFRDTGRLSDRFKNKSGDEILQSLREQLDQDKKMFFDSTPAWGETASTKSPFTRAGFPFDDVEDSRLPRSSRLQRHLDEIASRHPEFAEHLRPDMSSGRVWGSRPRHGSGGSSGTGVFSSEDDPSDNRSQTSGGSSEASAVAGATSSTEPVPQEPTKLPQYGLRNTVDLGGAAQKLEQSERNQRSWSAPPDARTSEPAQPKRFISRIEIQPKVPGNPGVQQPQQQPPSPPIYSSSPGKPPIVPKTSNPKQGSNVRQIPIFVEGRDEPVIARDVTDESKPMGVPHPTAHPEHFQTEFSGSPHFADSAFTDAFSDHPFADRFSRPQFSNVFQQPHFTPPPQQQHVFRTHGFHPTSQQQPVPPQKRPTAAQTPPTKRPTDGPAPVTASSPPPPPPPPPPPSVPAANDPLSKVAAVQRNVDAITEQVSQFSGSTRADKQYIYLDEMLTRNLIQLDDIDTQGKEDIRQARKDTIRSIQRAISMLESKAPVTGATKTENNTSIEMEDPNSGVHDCGGNGCNEGKSETQDSSQTCIGDAVPSNLVVQATSADSSGDAVQANQMTPVVKCSSATAMEQGGPVETSESIVADSAAGDPSGNSDGCASATTEPSLVGTDPVNNV